MVGKLDDMETKGFLWIIGESHSGTSPLISYIRKQKPVQATVEMTGLLLKLIRKFRTANRSSG